MPFLKLFFIVWKFTTLHRTLLLSVSWLAINFFTTVGFFWFFTPYGGGTHFWGTMTTWSKSLISSQIVFFIFLFICIPKKARQAVEMRILTWKSTPGSTFSIFFFAANFVAIMIYEDSFWQVALNSRAARHKETYDLWLILWLWISKAFVFLPISFPQLILDSFPDRGFATGWNRLIDNFPLNFVN